MQLLLPLMTFDPYEGEVIYGSGNADVIDWFNRYPEWPLQHICIVGTARSGKSSFAHIFQRKLGALLLKNFEVEEFLRDSSSFAAIIVDDADKTPEHLLFSLYNQQKHANLPLIFFTQKHPREWQCKTLDFQSRLHTFLTLMIQEPDDMMVKSLIFKHLKSHGVIIDAQDLEYISLRLERSYAVIESFCVAIIEQTLRLHKPLTRGLLKSLLLSTQNSNIT